MRRTIMLSVIVFAGAATTAACQGDTKTAQQGAPTAMMTLSWNDLTGDWVGNSIQLNSDSVVTPVTFAFDANQKAWLKFPNREPVPARVTAMGGDSVIVEAGPYPSVTRQGRTVTVAATLHVRNHMLWGKVHAAFDDGQTTDTRIKANHQMH